MSHTHSLATILDKGKLILEDIPKFSLPSDLKENSNCAVKRRILRSFFNRCHFVFTYLFNSA